MNAMNIKYALLKGFDVFAVVNACDEDIVILVANAKATLDGKVAVQGKATKHYGAWYHAKAVWKV